MNFVNAKGLAIGGALLVFAGMFLPLYVTAASRSANFFGFPITQYLLLLVLLAAVLGLAFTRHIRHVLWLGIVILFYLGLALYGLHSMMERYRLSVSTDLSDEIRAEYADRLTVSLGIGWIPLMLGAVLIIASGILVRRAAKAAIATPA